MATYTTSTKWLELPEPKEDPKTVCNFCKQVTTEDKLIAGPGINICVECVDLCNDIIADRQAEHRKKTIEDMAKTLCESDTALVAERAIALASSIFDAGYRKDGA
ncbi:ClpX C4-type zinc finger protein [Klebsiella aerogenes]|uniref:ClpX C4-type zinc finger protein n=1 Tax=Klebsiella aerogenes TaxID=548 RepID=UPI003D32E3F5